MEHECAVGVRQRPKVTYFDPNIPWVAGNSHPISPLP